MAGQKRKFRLKRKWPVIAFFLLAFCMLGGGYLYAMYWLYPPLPADSNHVVQEAGDDLPEPPKGRINLLLLGTDARKGEERTRTDSIILASIDAASKQAAVLSIPRDTRVEIPGHGVDRINAANVYGGPELVTRTVEKLLGIPIDDYILTNFSGFEDIVDTLGGITIDVEKNMYYYDPTDNYLINLKKGSQRMDGDKSLQYVRFRSDALGDISRTDRQQKFLKAVAKEILQPATIVKLPKLIPDIKRNVQTNLGVMDMLALARAAKDMDDLEIVSETLPGRFMDIDGLSYWGVDPVQAKEVVAKLFDGETMSNVVQSPTVTSNVASKNNNANEASTEKNTGSDDPEDQAEKKNEAGTQEKSSSGSSLKKDSSTKIDVTITPEKTGGGRQAEPEEDPVDSSSGREDSVPQSPDSTGESTAGGSGQGTSSNARPADSESSPNTEMPAWLGGPVS